MKRTLHLFRDALVAGVFAVAAGFASQPDYIVAAFSNMNAGGPINGWQELTLGDAKKSTYALVEDGGAIVVRGRADGSASGIVRNIEIDPNRFPVLT